MGSACGFEGGFGALPSLGVARGCPKREGVGPDDGDFSKALQPFSVAGVEQFVVAPLGGEKSGRHRAASSATSCIFESKPTLGC